MFSERAVLECFYGPLWGTEDRLQLLRQSSMAGATDYVYGPAADLRTGALWRIPYGTDAGDLEALLQEADDNGMRVTWRVSPGAPLSPQHSISFADEEDLRILDARIRDVAGLGFGRVLIAFDDLAARLSTADRAMFGHDPHPIAAAHAAVIARAHRVTATLGLDLLVCPLHYWGTTPSHYRTRLADLLPAEVPVCWTGPTVTSRRISVADAHQVTQQWKRPVWLWDNIPVNDWDGVENSFSNDTEPRRAPVFAPSGREAGLSEVLAAYGTNAALDAQLSIPATTAALAWARDPHGYDPATALVDAALAAGLDPAGVRAVADIAGASPSNGGPGPVAVTVCRVLAEPGTADAAVAELDHWRQSLATFVDGDSGLSIWARRADAQLAAAVQGLLIYTGKAEDDGTLAQLASRARAEKYSIAHGSIAALLDWIQGAMGAPAPLAHPDDGL